MIKVSLFSSGLDSFISDWIHLKEKNENVEYHRAYFNIKTSYSENEIKHLRKYYLEKDIDIITNLSLENTETEDKHVPQRNLLFCCLSQALYNADEIILSGVLDDRVSDNDKEFRELASSILTKTSEKKVKVTSPLENLEKSIWVKKWAKEHEDRSKIVTHTFSCFNNIYQIYKVPIYEAENKILYLSSCNKEEIEKIEEANFNLSVYIDYPGCLCCPACFRKICALTAANIYINFHNIDILKKYKNQIEKMKETLPNRAATIHNYIHFYEKMIIGEPI